MVMTKMSRSMDATGVLSLCEDKRDFKAVVTTILSSLSDIFPLCRDGWKESAVAQCLVCKVRLYVTTRDYLK